MCISRSSKFNFGPGLSYRNVYIGVGAGGGDGGAQLHYAGITCHLVHKRVYQSPRKPNSTHIKNLFVPFIKTDIFCGFPSE